MANEAYWREETRAVEDRLSDALHDALTQRFVDRRTSILMRRLKQKESLVADVNTSGEVTVEGEFVGKLNGFRFQLDKSASEQEAKTLRAAATQALQPEFSLRADRMYNAPDTEFDFTEQGGLMWGENAVGKLSAGADALSPVIDVFVDEEAGADVATKVARRLGHFIDRKITAAFEPLIALKDDETVVGLARGVAFRLVESLGGTVWQSTWTTWRGAQALCLASTRQLLWPVSSDHGPICPLSVWRIAGALVSTDG